MPGESYRGRLKSLLYIQSNDSSLFLVVSFLYIAASHTAMYIILLYNRNGWFIHDLCVLLSCSVTFNIFLT